MGSDNILNNKFCDHTSWQSIYGAGLLSLITNAQYTIYFSSVWPYLQVLVPNIKEEFYGFLFASYSIGTIVFSPVFGWWSNKLKGIKIPLYTGVLCQLIGNIIYLSLGELSEYRKEFMVIARFINGIGGANVSLFRSYAATSSLPKDRTSAISIVNCGLSIGFALGPFFNILFAVIGYPEYRILNLFTLNIYTLSAFISTLLNIISLCCIKFFFKEKYAGINEKYFQSKNLSKISEPIKNIPKYDKKAVGIIFFIRFTMMFIKNTCNILNPFLSMTMFNFTKKETIETISIIEVFIGSTAVLIHALYVCFNLGKYGKFRQNLIIGLSLLAIFHLIIYPYPFLYDNKSTVTITNTNKINITSSTEQIGCNINKFNWCYNLPKISPSLYFISYTILVGLALPIINANMNTIFSKILGPRFQGTMHGLNQTCGSIAQALAPLVTSTVYKNFGPTKVWWYQIVLSSFTILLCLTNYNKLD
ncbi:Major facilitator superfamily and Major facilitator superfamily domain, general substrate transporter and Major facilitator superfamily domain-containing protein [Strongyloides ratti]|uniref:Major facilitator superfamily and Major facilitator superfamily domain, general substrate transporter and Major facilitator superfamily domain-containing protein n=1 Tax=Strongyloides ratti TaxID=34506 RepID=A0A090L4T1_STRRB|nr:Major facilitator superfamily and Major facilitator superfamily domain, general substrate transporter and Major facilitator superfamily domain-containing protein [Strongyloides ratti]CEF63127.1 Major facilitator superfamily and Major facilitator superfamily domain, general substrate transporter and Major facilitator superfamily domain-containing protein [Strongyloides ratti]